MKTMSSEMVDFFRSQGYLIISTIDKEGRLHNACKGLVDIDHSGRLYLLDLYRGATYQNLLQNDHISVTAVDEHKFKGYSIKGRASIIRREDMEPRLIKAWEDKITSRITERVIRNITQKKGHPLHPEASFPDPKYLIVVEAGEVVDLTPRHLKHHGKA